MMVGRYAQAHIHRKIESDPALEDRFGPLLDLALRVRHQE
jgi:IS5 family transposase